MPTMPERHELMLWVTWDNGHATTAVAYTGTAKLNAAQTRSKIRLFQWRNPTMIVTGKRWRVIR